MLLAWAHQQYIFFLWGGVSPALGLCIFYVWFWKVCYENHVKSPSWQLVSLQGKLKTNWKIKKYRLLSLYYIFQYSSVLLISEYSGWFRLESKSRKIFDTTVPTKCVCVCVCVCVFVCFFLISLRAGGCSSDTHPPPPGAPMIRSMR